MRLRLSELCRKVRQTSARNTAHSLAPNCASLCTTALSLFLEQVAIWGTFQSILQCHQICTNAAPALTGWASVFSELASRSRTKFLRQCVAFASCNPLRSNHSSSLQKSHLARLDWHACALVLCELGGVHTEVLHGDEEAHDDKHGLEFVRTLCLRATSTYGSFASNNSNSRSNDEQQRSL